MYHITNYSKKKAKELNVQIRPSTNQKKKIDVFKDNKKIILRVETLILH